MFRAAIVLIVGGSHQDGPEAEIAAVQHELETCASQMDSLRHKSLAAMERVDPAVLVRQLEVQFAQICDLVGKLKRVTREHSVALQELRHWTKESERLSRDLAEIERRLRPHPEEAREGERAPARNGRVTQVSRSRVRVDLGLECGVRAGEFMMVRRETELIGVVQVTEVELECSHGRILMDTGAILQGGWVTH